MNTVGQRMIKWDRISDNITGDGGMCVRGQVGGSGVEGRGMELRPLG